MHTNLPIISSAGLFHSQSKYADTKRYPEQSVSKLRTVVDYELELFTQDGGVSHINGKSYPIHKGDILIAQPGDKRQSTLHFSALYLHFGTTDSAIQELIRSISGFHPGMDFDKLEPLLSEISEMVLRFDPISDMLAAAKLICFLCTIKKDCSTAASAPSVSDRYSVVSNAIEYMKQTYAEPLTVNHIAEHCGLSVSYFYKVFLETVHTTPNNYLFTLRLSAAKAMLVTTNLPISEVSERCGFHSQSYFCDCFKKGCGMSPKQFRKTFTQPYGD